MDEDVRGLWDLFVSIRIYSHSSLYRLPPVRSPDSEGQKRRPAKDLGRARADLYYSQVGKESTKKKLATTGHDIDALCKWV
jgi:hypothetical protein